MEKRGDKTFIMEEFMFNIGLTNVALTTAWRWIRLLGFGYQNINKSFYTDKHEDKKMLAIESNLLRNIWSLK